MTRIRIEDVWPLSPLQEGLLFHAGHDERARDVYVEQRVLDLAAPLEPDVLRASWQAMLDRHASLRAGFRQPAGAPRLVQVIVAGAVLPWREIDLSGRPTADARAEAERLAEDERERGFDVATPPLLRLVLIRMSGTRYRLLVTMHHIVLDGWSLPILFREVSQVYAAGGDASVLPPVAPYRDYLAWLERQDRDAARAAWAGALAGVAEPTLVAPVAPGTESVPPRHVVEALGAETAGALREVARLHGLTPNTLVQGAWGLAIGALTGRRDVVFGATVSGRPADLPGVERMLGLFINTLPVRVTLDPARTVLDVLTEVQARQIGLMDHQHLGLSDIRRAAGPGATFDTILVYENSCAKPKPPRTPRNPGLEGRRRRQRRRGALPAHPGRPPGRRHVAAPRLPPGPVRRVRRPHDPGPARPGAAAVRRRPGRPGRRGRGAVARGAAAGGGGVERHGSSGAGRVVGGVVRGVCGAGAGCGGGGRGRCGVDVWGVERSR
ncbi:condensation domain-containing protein [Actinomadura sp. WMMB 499]|uniref:condensation domain-containing protein n=1 Tax=Actinomadura sp. WMMB 499 TaxID=1219491 RepID=UPI00159D7F8A|nr:condensation domain-containing protein [Actinomadura sp. WMMB 499]